MSQERIIAVALLTEQDLDRLGDTFTRLWPIEDASCFEELLAAIDEADREADKPAIRQWTKTAAKS